MLCNVLYEPWNPEHIQRVHKMWTDPMGTERVPGYFKTMLTRVCDVEPSLGFFN